MRKWFALSWVLLLLGIVCVFRDVQAQPRWGIFQDSAGCSSGTAANNFIARTSGLSATENNAFCNLINGLVTDGIITGDLSGASGCGSVLDGMYVFATNSRTDANLNICGTAFPATQHGTNLQCVFTADAGYTGDGANCVFSTGYAPASSGINWAGNAAGLGACVLTGNTGTGAVEIGGTNGINSWAFIQSSFGGELNAGNFPTGPSPGSWVGSWAVTRTNATSINFYGPSGSSTPLSSPADNSGVNEPSELYVLALNNGGSAGTNPVDISPDQVAYAYWGGGITGAQYALIYTRLHTFLGAVGAPAGC